MALFDRASKDEEKTSRPSLTNTAATTVFLMTVLTVFTKLIGTVRTLLFARAFGSGIEADAFSLAQRIPTTLFDLLFSAVLSVGLLTVLGGMADREKKNRFSAFFLTLICGAGALCSILGILLCPAILSLLPCGLDEGGIALCQTLLQLLFPSLFFCSLTYGFIALHHDRGSYLIPSLSSLLSGAVAVLYLLVSKTLPSQSRIVGFAVVSSIGWLMQALLPFLTLKKIGMRMCLALSYGKEAMTAIRVAIPATLHAVTLPISALLGVWRASALIDGGGALYDYAVSLFLLFCALSVSCTVSYFYPKLTRARSHGIDTVAKNGACVCLALALPLAICGWFLYDRGVCLLYLRGAFTARDAATTASVFRILCLALPLSALSTWLCRVCFVRKLLRLPAAFSILAITVTGAVTAASSSPTQIAAATAAGQAVFLLLLLPICPKLFSRNALNTLGRMLFKIVVAALAFGLGMALLCALPFPSPYEVGAMKNLLICFLIFLPPLALYLAILRRFFPAVPIFRTKEVSS